MEYPSYIDTIIRRLESHGESAYIVGGSLRDIILGTAPHDYDVTTSALPERTAEIFCDKHVIETGIRHGTVTVVFDGFPVEITTFRIDGSYTDSRHPDSVRFTDDITLDLSRRDFTVNAMAYNRVTGLIDPFGGRGDIERKLIRAVGDPTVRFTEDALRIMRAFRFCAQLGFEIDVNTLDAAHMTADRLKNIARERIGSEFIRLITSPSPALSLRLMTDRGIMPYVLGSYTPREELIQKLTLMPPSDTARLGFLLCDAGADTAREILHSLRCSGKQITGAMAVARGIKAQIDTETDARRLIASVGIYAPDAALGSELLGYSPVGAGELTARQQNTPCSVRDLKINGKDVALLGASGKQIGQTLDAILSAVVDSPELNERQTLLAMAKQIITK